MKQVEACIILSAGKQILVCEGLGFVKAHTFSQKLMICFRTFNKKFPD